MSDATPAEVWGDLGGAGAESGAPRRRDSGGQARVHPRPRQAPRRDPEAVGGEVRRRARRRDAEHRRQLRFDEEWGAQLGERADGVDELLRRQRGRRVLRPHQLLQPSCHRRQRRLVHPVAQPGQRPEQLGARGQVEGVGPPARLDAQLMRQRPVLHLQRGERPRQRRDRLRVVPVQPGKRRARAGEQQRVLAQPQLGVGPEGLRETLRLELGGAGRRLLGELPKQPRVPPPQRRKRPQEVGQLLRLEGARRARAGGLGELITELTLRAVEHHGVARGAGGRCVQRRQRPRHVGDSIRVQALRWPALVCAPEDGRRSCGESSEEAAARERELGHRPRDAGHRARGDAGLLLCEHGGRLIAQKI